MVKKSDTQNVLLIIRDKSGIQAIINQKPMSNS